MLLEEREMFYRLTEIIKIHVLCEVLTALESRVKQVSFLLHP